ncbi:MAG: hypothetical protein ACFFC0_07785 [Promethearchaeota archaeon]
MSGKSVRVATAIIIAIILVGIGAAVYLIQISSESFESRTISHNTNLNPNLR